MRLSRIEKNGLHEAVRKRRHRAERDQRIHIGDAFDESFGAAGEEMKIDDDDRERQNQLHRVIDDGRGLGKPHHAAHRKIEQGHKKDEGKKEAPFESIRLRLFLFPCLFVERRRSVAEFPDGGDELFPGNGGFVIFHDHRFAHQRNFRFFDALHLVQGALYSRRTRGTRHSRDRKFFFHKNSLWKRTEKMVRRLLKRSCPL